MTTTLNATTSNGLVVTPDNSGNIVLQYNGQSAPTFSAYQSTTSQGISNASMTKVTFDSEEWDTNNNFASSRFTPTVAGYYQINASISFQTPITPTGECQVNIYKNGGFYRSGTDISTGSNSSFYALTISALVYANGTTDYFEIFVYQTSGATKNVYGSPSLQTYFQGCLLRGA